MPTDPELDGHSWTPDIIILEDAGEGLLSNTKYTDLIINSTGEIFNDVFGDIDVSFSPIIDYYPFDY